MAENCGNDTPSRTGENVGADALPVVARTLQIFSTKKLFSASTLRDGQAEVRPRPSSLSTDSQVILGQPGDPESAK